MQWKAPILHIQITTTVKAQLGSHNNAYNNIPKNLESYRVKVDGKTFSSSQCSRCITPFDLAFSATNMINLTDSLTSSQPHQLKKKNLSTSLKLKRHCFPWACSPTTLVVCITGGLWMGVTAQWINFCQNQAVSAKKSIFAKISLYWPKQAHFNQMFADSLAFNLGWIDL